MSKQSPAQKATLARQAASLKGRPSNNPGGRPRMPADLKDAFKGHGQEALDTLVGVMRSPTARDADKVRAAEVVLNRGYGMPTQQVEVDMNHQINISGALADMRRLREQRDLPIIEAQAIDVTPRKA